MANSPKFPKPTKEEKNLQREQTSLLRQQGDMIQEQLRRQDLLAPILFKQAGLEPQFNEQGQVIGFTEMAENDTLKDLRLDIEKRFLERTQAALKGELPVDPGLLRELDEGGARLEESLMKQLGSGFATSTPGIQAMAEFNKRRSEILDAARRGDLTLAEQLGQARSATNLAHTGARMETILGSIAAPFEGSGDLGALANLFNMPLQLGLTERQNRHGANMQRFLNSPLNRFLLNPAEQFMMSSAQTAGRMAGSGGMGVMFGR